MCGLFLCIVCFVIAFFHLLYKRSYKRNHIGSAGIQIVRAQTIRFSLPIKKYEAPKLLVDVRSLWVRYVREERENLPRILVYAAFLRSQKRFFLRKFIVYPSQTLLYIDLVSRHLRACVTYSTQVLLIISSKLLSLRLPQTTKQTQCFTCYSLQQKWLLFLCMLLLHIRTF